MPKKPINYSKNLIYKLVCKDLNITDCYVGHTTNFKQRKKSHKSSCNNQNRKQYNFNVYKFIRENGGWNNWNMIEIKKYPCNDKREAEAEERRYYEQLNSNLNSQAPFRTEDEKKEQRKEQSKKYNEENKDKKKEQNNNYREKNKEKIKEQSKKYNEENKDKIKEQNKNYKEKNKDKIKEQNKNYKENNKDKIKKKINCECGGKYTHANISIHLKTKKHQNYLNN